MELSEHSKESLRALTAWWEDAGVSVDQKSIDRILKVGSAPKQPARTASDPSSPSAPAAAPQSSSARAKAKAEGPLTKARALADGATTLEALRAAIEGFDGCDLKTTASKTVIADGNPAADIMVIGEGPGRDEDKEGRPFVGNAGHLLDRMLASIGLSRKENTYITNVNYWRPPGNRNPSEDELAICRPFVDKHIALVKPKLIIAAGTVTAKSLLGVEEGITRLRGRQFDLTVPGLSSPVPVFPIFHPAYLLRRPAEKAKAWSDLLNILNTLETLGIAPDKRP
ncbi:uracil-DNA glycosylase [Ponticaulis sp.]|uniref:uracil-DNA glycosylase n=1 Tax=Ponticaulis sp. TaxID=2020902 RepID=UPI000B6D1FCC|nr:uracil-DNA glycosylase [Ponticaulis sp.]MAI91478.1 uracil-DNA glycosylase [Ponticaulis sp.]OUX97832.1 MAG: hypothetical protein CBB65_13630 [Hyphomonadaceae bacterium TMED5]|tara:strand:- start:12892 stop:13740 length:849 start_codon:yes stop_codon:yes gene_type:complete